MTARLETVAPGLPPIEPTALTAPFWEGCRKGKLVLQQCQSCGKFRFYPCAGCPYCRERRAMWRAVSGKGRIYSWIVVHRSVDPYWQQRTPFATGVIELDEQQGLYIPGLIVGANVSRLEAGMPLSVEFERSNEVIALPRWRVLPKD